MSWGDDGPGTVSSLSWLAVALTVSVTAGFQAEEMMDTKERIKRVIYRACHQDDPLTLRNHEFIDRLARQIAAALSEPPKLQHSPLPWRKNPSPTSALFVDANGEPVFFGDGDLPDLILRAVNSREDALKLARMVHNYTEYGVSLSRHDAVDELARKLLREAGEG